LITLLLIILLLIILSSIILLCLAAMGDWRRRGGQLPLAAALRTSRPPALHQSRQALRGGGADADAAG